MNSQSDVEERSSHPAYGSEHFDTVIIGGGQAGLSVGYHLKKQGRPFVILDANERIGDSWRKRWDSLRLFTPARYSGLTGWRFPAPAVSFPRRTRWPTTSNPTLPDSICRFEPASRWTHSPGWEIDSSLHPATAVSKRNAWSSRRAPTNPQGSTLRRRASSEHRAAPFEPVPQPFPASGRRRSGGGAGNSGAEIAFEVSRTSHIPLWQALGRAPVRHGPAMARFVFPVIRFVGNHVLTLRTPIGRKVQPKFISHGAPLIRVKLKDLAAAGVEQVPRTVGVSGRPALEDGGVLEVSNVIWCTGFGRISWIELPIFGEDGRPLHERGVVVGEPGCTL